MSTPDLGHKLTDKRLAALEKQISDVYEQAAKDMQDKIKAYFDGLKKRDEAQKAKLDAGDITDEYYKQWRLAQIGRGERMEALKKQLAERMTKANEVAAAYINDSTPGIYSLNRNYAAYTIEQVAGDVGFTLWDEQTVKRLITQQPNLMPYYPEKRAVKRGIDLAWGKKQITAQITQGILQGESIKRLADRLRKNIPDMNRNSAIRAARTAVTGAQNAGRMDSYEAAKLLGIEVRKQWMATLDSRTRHSHAVLDGETIDTSDTFDNGCMYPGDPDGPPSEIYNCRCTLIAAMPDVDISEAQRRARDPETGESVLIEDMTYSEWTEWKQSQYYATAAETRKTVDANTAGTNILAQNYESHRTTNNLASVPYKDLVSDGSSVKIVYANYGNVSEDVANNFNSVIAGLSGDYDTPLSVVRTMTKEEYMYYKDSFAYVSHDYTTDSATLVINQAKCKDAKSLAERIKELSENGYCVRVLEGKELEYVGTHEFAHTIANMTQKLSEKTNWVGADYDKIKSFRKEIQSAYGSYIQEVGEYESKRNEYQKIADSLTDFEEILSVFDKIETVNDEMSLIKLSDYSMASADEFMAEAFTNAKIGERNNKYSDIVIDIIERYFGNGR